MDWDNENIEQDNEDDSEYDDDDSEHDGNNSNTTDCEEGNNNLFEMDLKLERIAESMLLTTEMNERPFYVEDSLTSNEINVEVEKIGKLNFPINQAKIENLLNISSEAKFGLREQTLLDKNIRDTHVIAAEKLNVTFKQLSLTRVLNRMKKELGMEENCKLVPHLHNLLVYGVGQFFSKHQDTEKVQNMIATMVIVLPSPHIGGNLIIEHGVNKHAFISENIASTSAKCIAFFCDCVHEVEKVREGYRCTLTYNICLESECVRHNIANEDLKEAIKNYFEEQNKLVYLLNHTYTEHGLKWNLLKGEDRINISEILAVARQLNLVPHLTLVQIKKSYSTAEDDPYFNYQPTVVKFNEEEITLSYWVSKMGSILPYKEYSVSDFEICWTKETKSFEAHNKVFEGFTGNEGGTYEKWYRRAAVVMWHESKQIQIAFELNYEKELKRLNEMIELPGYEEKVSEIVKKAGASIYPNYSQDVVNNLVDVALYIKNAETAKIIFTHLEWNILNPDIAERFAKLNILYGGKWLIDIFNVWKNKRKNHLILKLNTFVKKFINYEGDAQAMEFILDVQLDAIIHHDKKKIYSWESISKYINDTLLKRMKFLQQLFKACSKIENISVLKKAIEYVISNQEYYPEISLAELLVKIRKDCTSNYFAHFEILKAYLIKAIEKELLGQRSANDWSISTVLTCACELCTVVQSFLISKHEKNKLWPLVEKKRTHIKRQLTALDVPVDVSVEKGGSPHKLLLVKNDKLHREASKKSDSLKSYLKILTDMS